MEIILKANFQKSKMGEKNKNEIRKEQNVLFNLKKPIQAEKMTNMGKVLIACQKTLPGPRKSISLRNTKPLGLITSKVESTPDKKDRLFEIKPKKLILKK